MAADNVDLWGEKEAGSELMGVTVGTWTKMLVKLGATSPGALLAAKDLLFGVYTTVFGRGRRTPLDITAAFVSIGYIPTENWMLHMVFGVGVDPGQRATDILSSPRNTEYDDDTGIRERLGEAQAAFVTELGSLTPLLDLLRIPSKKTMEAVFARPDWTTAVHAVRVTSGDAHETPEFLAPVIQAIAGSGTLDDENVSPGFEETIARIYLTQQSQHDKDAIRNGTVDHVKRNPPSSGRYTICPVPLGEVMQRVRVAWLAGVYATYINATCVPVMNRMYLSYLMSFFDAKSYQENAEIASLIDMSMTRNEYRVRKYVLGTIITDLQSQSLAFTHPVTEEEVRYWLMRGMEAAFVRGTPNYGNVKMFASLKSLAAGYALDPVDICETLKAFKAPVPLAWLDSVYKEWAELHHDVSKDDGGMVFAGKWFSDFRVRAIKHSVISDVATPQPSMAEHLERVKKLCIDRYLLWVLSGRGSSRLGKWEDKLSRFEDVTYEDDEDGRCAQILDFLRHVWYPVIADSPNYMRVFEFLKRGIPSLQTETPYDRHMDIVSRNGDIMPHIDAKELLAEVYILYRDNVARFNWHEGFYAKWAMQSASYGPVNASYVARLDTLQLRAIEHTAGRSGVIVQVGDAVDRALLMESELVLPLRHWPVYRTWHTLCVTWTYYATGDESSEARKSAKKQTLALKLVQAMVPKISIMGALLLDHHDVPKHAKLLHVWGTCTLRGQYEMSAEVPVLSDPVEVSRSFHLLCR